MSYSYERANKGQPGEKKHPIKRVPGMGNAQWSSEIGRWVVKRAASERAASL